MKSAAASWRASADAATREREVQGVVTRCRVIDALKASPAPISIHAIGEQVKISYGRARRALESLVALRVVRASGPANNRRFEFIANGTAPSTGGPASDSAALGCAGDIATGAARPGRVA